LEEFDRFINELLVKNQFKVLDLDNLARELKTRYEIDFSSRIDEWLKISRIPGYIVSDIGGYKVVDDERTRYQVLFKISNKEPVPGLLKITLGTGQRGMFRLGSESKQKPLKEKFISMLPDESKQVGIVLDQKPGTLVIDTFISKNIPSAMSTELHKFESNDKIVPFDGEKMIDHQIADPDDIIVDNEDSSFEVVNPESKTKLKQFLKKFFEEDDDEYEPFHWYYPPSKWRAVADVKYYGKYKHSARYTKAGTGESKVVWNAVIPKSGNYDLYCYQSEMPSGHGGRRRRRQKSQIIADSYYYVHHDDGVEEVKLDPDDAEIGWNLLGSYYVSSGTVKVELTNKSNGKVVVADAIKWVKN